LIKIINDNLLNAKCNLIVHQVNCKGVMASGIAKEIRNNYPIVYQEYISFLKRNKRVEYLGKIQVVPVNKYRSVVNFYSQYNYGRVNGMIYTNYAAFKLCLKRIRKYMLDKSFKEIAFPYNIGCGLGGGDWSIISEMIADILKEFTIYFYKI